MPLYTSTTNTGGLLSPDFGPLVVQPAISASVFAQVANVVTTSSTHYRIPIVPADPTSAWVSEGSEISPSDATLQELVVTPPKVAGLSIISRELADDSDPAAQAVVGEALARDISKRIDQAAFAGLSSPAPAGLTPLSGIQTYVNASPFANLDFAAQAISKAETVGATVTAFVTSPAVALALATVKQAEGSNQPVFGVDATSATSRSILGVPLHVSQFVAASTLWAIDMSRVWLVVRSDATIEADRSCVLFQRQSRCSCDYAGGLRLRSPRCGRQSHPFVTTDTVTVKIRDGWIMYDGKTQRTGGETVALDSDLAHEYLAAGWVELAPDVTTHSRKG